MSKPKRICTMLHHVNKPGGGMLLPGEVVDADELDEMRKGLAADLEQRGALTINLEYAPEDRSAKSQAQKPEKGKYDVGVPKLKELATARGIEFNSRVTKKDLVQLLEEADVADASGAGDGDGEDARSDDDPETAAAREGFMKMTYEQLTVVGKNVMNGPLPMEHDLLVDALIEAGAKPA